MSIALFFDTEVLNCSPNRVDALNDMPGADAKADSEWMEVSLILVRKSASAGTELKR
jgi:hypothetical protein